MSPITTTVTMPITTITRKPVNIVAELALWIPDTTDRLEGNSAGAKVQHANALKSTSEFGSDAVVDWMQWFGVPTLAGGPAADRMPGRLIGESLDKLGNPTFRLALQTQEQHIRLDEDQLTTDTTDLKMTDDALAKDTAAFEDTTKDCLAIQAKAVEFKACNKSLSEDSEALAKARAVISEKTGDVEYQDNRSGLSSRGGSANSLTKSEHSIELAQLASRVVSAMHTEIFNGDDPFAKVKCLISDMSTRLEERRRLRMLLTRLLQMFYTVVHRTDGLKTIAKRVHGVSQLFSFFDETY